MKKILVLMLFALCLAAPAFAGDPILSMKRLSFAVGGDYHVAPVGLDGDERWAGVFSAAYNVMSPDAANPSRPRVSLTARWSQALDPDARPSGEVGFRYTLPFFGGAPQR